MEWAQFSKEGVSVQCPFNESVYLALGRHPHMISHSTFERYKLIGQEESIFWIYSHL